MTFDTEYELQQFRDVQSEYFDEEGKVYPNVNSQHACNRMLKLINTLETELKSNGVLADVVTHLEWELFAFNKSCENTGNDVVKQSLQEMFFKGIEHCINTLKKE